MVKPPRGERAFEVQAARPAFRVLGHDNRLGQVVRNLVDNARSFTTPGTQVHVRLRRTRRTIARPVGALRVVFVTTSIMAPHVRTRGARA